MMNSPSNGQSPALDLAARMMGWAPAAEERSAADEMEAWLRSRPERFPEADTVLLTLARHPAYGRHRDTIRRLIEADRRWGIFQPDLLSIAPGSAAADLTGRMFASEIVSKVALDRYGIGGQCEQRVAAVMDVLDGARPVVFLTEGQQQALWHSDAPYEPPVNPVFPKGPVVYFPQPVEVNALRLRGIIVRHPDERESPEDAGFAMVDMLSDAPTNGGDWTRLWMSTVLFNDVADPETAVTQERLRRFIHAVIAAIDSFGLSEGAPPVQMTRAERRRQERETAKQRPVPGVAVRYLRDPRGRVAAVHKSEGTGRSVKPHWRRGHFRSSLAGPMSLPREERPTVRNFIPPVIVNAHLGPPSGVVAYRCQDPIDA